MVLSLLVHTSVQQTRLTIHCRSFGRVRNADVKVKLKQSNLWTTGGHGSYITKMHVMLSSNTTKEYIINGEGETGPETDIRRLRII